MWISQKKVVNIISEREVAEAARWETIDLLMESLGRQGAGLLEGSRFCLISRRSIFVLSYRKGLAAPNETERAGCSNITKLKYSF